MRRRGAWVGAALLAAAGCAGPSGRPEARESFEYHFDRNSLVDSVLAGRHLIAITASGNLLRFDVGSLKLEGERHPRSRAVCLGEGRGGTVLAGFEDGSVGRVDPGTLETTTLGRFAGRPLWVRESDVLLAVLHLDGSTCELRRGGEANRFRIESIPVEGPPGTFHLDGRRLWMGIDRGEWGGWLGFLDLASGKLTEVRGRALELSTYGVYGISASPDGRLFAFGGLTHMGSSTSFLWEVGPEGARTLHSREGRRADQAGPSMPITHVVPDGAGEFLVFSYGQVFRSDAAFRTWSLVGQVDARMVAGRPDAVGSYPALRRLHVTSTSPLELLASTARDGLWAWRRDKARFSSLPAQLEAVQPTGVLPSADGAMIVDGEWRQTAWRRSGGAWRPLPEELPERPAEGCSWYDRRFFRGPSGELRMYVQDNSTPGRGMVVRRENEAWILERTFDPRPVDVFLTFTTADGALWGVDRKRLFRLDGGRWEEAAVTSEAGGPWRASKGRPGLLFDTRENRLLKHTRNGLDALPIDTPVYDAIGTEGESWIIATADGPRGLDRAGRLVPAPWPELRGRVERLARDGRGRIWAGGDGLWVLDRGAWARVDGHALLEAPKVGFLAADPDRPDSVIVGLSTRGLLFVGRPPSAD